MFCKLTKVALGLIGGMQRYKPTKGWFYLFPNHGWVIQHFICLLLFQHSTIRKHIIGRYEAFSNTLLIWSNLLTYFWNKKHVFHPVFLLLYLYGIILLWMDGQGSFNLNGILFVDMLTPKFPTSCSKEWLIFT